MGQLWGLFLSRPQYPRWWVLLSLLFPPEKCKSPGSESQRPGPRLTPRVGGKHECGLGASRQHRPHAPEPGDTGEARLGVGELRRWLRRWEGAGRGWRPVCSHLTLGASPSTSANLVSTRGSQGVSWDWEWGGGSLERTGYCVSRPFPWKGGASLSRKPWLAFKATTDLLIQPKKVWSCGRSGGCRGRPLGQRQRAAGRGFSRPNPLPPSKSPLCLQRRPPSPTTSPSPRSFGGNLFSRKFHP